ncbi:septum formation family protein [Arthrobacter yangruifuii]|uniref:septum formation family protein n=1 Tax=Arthrobacter yangruifuii TaxID=2606616 RepID=UPI0011B83164|nr:septum formation family protein [Arthrobacter yangruifuii]
MSDQKNTPGADTPPPEQDGAPGASSDLNAHSESPADSPADASAVTGDAEASGLPPEPVVVAPQDLTLVEPSLAEPALSADAVEAAALEQIASETAAAEADAAEAGRLSGLEPAPSGAEIHVAKEAVEPDAGRTLPPPGKTEAAPGETTPAGEPAAPGEPGAPPSAEPAPEAGSEPPARDAPAHPLDGIDAAAPVTESPRDAAAEADTGTASGESGATTAAVRPGDTRRSRRLGETGQAAGASGAQQPGTASAAGPGPGRGSGPGRGTDTSSGAAGNRTDAASGAPVKPATAAVRGKSNRSTRLLLVLGGVVLAALIAILLFVFVFNDKAEGVISEDVSPVELASGACLQDWEDVNSEATVVTCDTPHSAQLVATESLPEDAGFPGTGALEKRVNEVCAEVDYTDAAAGLPDLLLTKSIPTEQTWAAGDRRVDCFVFSPNDQELTETLVSP